MKALLHRLAVLALGVLFGCSGSSDTSQRSLATDPSSTELNVTRTLTILHVNDSHSVLDAIGPKIVNSNGSVDGTLGGLTRAATVIANNTTANTLLLHAGDVFEGDLTFVGTQGALELGLLKQLGLAAFTLGNHEFDYGPNLLAAVLSSDDVKGLPVLSANLVADPQQPHPLSQLVTGHVVKVVGGTRIGIFGLTTPTDPLAITSPFTLASDVTRIAKAEVAALHEENVDLVILLSHLETELNEAIARIPDNGIDFIVAGHDEYLQTFKNHPPGRTSIVQAGNFYQFVGRLDLVLRNGHLIDAKHTLIPVDDLVITSPDVLFAVQLAQAGMNQALAEAIPFPGFEGFHTPIAVAATDLENLWTESMGARRDLGVGSLAADALKAKFTGAQLGVTTSGFLNDKIYAGPVTANDLFRSLPYGINPALLFPVEDAILPDPALVFLVNGSQLYAGLEVALANGEIPQVSDGAFMCFDLSAPEYSRMRFVLLGSAPVMPDSVGIPVATNIVIWQILNEAASQAGLDPIPLPPDFDPMISQFSALLEYAVGKSQANAPLTAPADPRVQNLPGDGCQAWLMTLLAP